MKRIFSTVLQWAVVAALVAWGCILAVVILGEDAPEMRLGIAEFFALKFMAIGSAYATVQAAGWCRRHGLFPTAVERMIEKCEEEEV